MKKQNKAHKYFNKSFVFNSNAVLDASGMSVEDITKRDRTRDIKDWRQIFAYFLWVEGLTFNAIGGIIHRDHATIMWGNKKVVDALEGYNDQLLEKINMVQSGMPQVDKNIDFSSKEIISLCHLEQNYANLAAHNSFFN